MKGLNKKVRVLCRGFFGHVSLYPLFGEERAVFLVFILAKTQDVVATFVIVSAVG